MTNDLKNLMQTSNTMIIGSKVRKEVPHLIK